MPIIMKLIKVIEDAEGIPVYGHWKCPECGNRINVYAIVDDYSGQPCCCCDTKPKELIRTYGE